MSIEDIDPENITVESVSKMICVPTFIARFICNVLVRDGVFKKVKDHYELIK